MNGTLPFFFFFFMVCVAGLLIAGEEKFPKDSIDASGGPIQITYYGHASVRLEHGGKTIYVDPFSEVADFSREPRADLILITHEHFDHLDLQAIGQIAGPETEFVVNGAARERLGKGHVMKNGDSLTVQGISLLAVPAYNMVHKRPNGEPFHPKGRGNGYLVVLGGRRIYLAGDTENTPEMKALKDIDVAFLPMNLPFTMTPEMVADAAKAFRPKILYPYHYDQTDPDRLVRLLEGEKDISVRILRK